MSKLVFIALGGNLGDVLGSFNYACESLAKVGKITAKSKLYSTKAVGGPADQPDYLNAVIVFSTNLKAPELLKLLLKIEAERGRVRRVKWGPRTLDLDILDYDSQIVNTESLTLPHPRMWERAFVLLPLADVAADYIHPAIKQTLSDRLKQIDTAGVDKAIFSW